MSRRFRDHNYKGWTIRASDYYDDWELELRSLSVKQWEYCHNNEEFPRFSTLKEAKDWINENGEEEAQRLIELTKDIKEEE
jgi:hypothetical protein